MWLYALQKMWKTHRKESLFRVREKGFGLHVQT
jgi:hypothetical protein